MFAGINKWICIFICTIQIFWHNVTANVMVTLELLHYQATPVNCCDRVLFICNECDPFLEVCISNRCQQTSRENDKSSIDLTNSLIRPHVFTELFNVWNGNIEIRIKATDYDTVGNDFIDEVHLNYSAPHSSKSNIITLTGKKLTITARITVDCITNFYGPQCTRYCQNTDHGKCDSSGNLTCQAGFFGQNCSLSSSAPAPTLTSKQLLAKSMLTMESNGNASKSVRITMPSTPITQPKTVISTSITVRNLMYVTYPNISTNERTIPSSTNVQTQMVSTTISNTKPTIMTLVSSRKIEPTRVLSTIASLTEPIINIIRKSSTTLATLTKTTMTESSIQKSENAAETTVKSTHISTTQPTTLRSLTTESSTGTSIQALTAINSLPDSRTEPTTMTMTKASTSKEHTSSTEVSTSNARTSSREASTNKVHTSSREVSTNKVHTSSTEASTNKAQTSSTEASTSKAHNSSTEALTSKAHILSTEASSNKVYNSSRESSTSKSNTSSTEAFASKSHTLISTTMPTSTSIISSTAHSMSATISKASIIEPTIVLSTTMSTNTTKTSRKNEQMTVKFLTTSAVPNIATPTYTPTFKQTRLLAASSLEPRTVASTITSTATFTPIQTMTTKPYKIKSTTPKTTSQTSTTAASQMTTTVSTATSTPKPLTILKTEPNTVTSTKSSTTEATSVSRTSTWTNDTTTLTSTTSSSTTISIRKTNETTTPHQTTMLPTATDQTTIAHQQTSRNELNSIISTSKAQNGGPTIASKPEQTTDTATNAPTTESLSLTSTKYSITGTKDRSSAVSTDEATTVYTVYSTIQPKSVLDSAEHSNELTTLTSIKMLTNESNKSHQTTKNETATVKCKTTSKTVSTTVASTTSLKEPTTLTSEANTLPKTNTVAIKPMPITKPATKTLVTTLQIEQDTVIPSINFTPEPKKVRSTTISLHEPTTVRSTTSSATKPTTVILKTDPATKIMTLTFKTTSRTERIPLVSIQSLNTKETIVTSTRTTTGPKEPSSKASTTQPKLLRSSDLFPTETTKTTSKETSTTKRTTLTTKKLTMQPTPVSENRQTAVSFINITVLIPTTMISSTSSTTEPTITNPASKTHTTLSATEPTMMTSTSVSRNDLTTIHSTKLTTEAINMTFRTISATQPTTVASTTRFTSKAIAETLPLFSNRTQTAQTFLNTVMTELITNISTTKATNKMNVISVTEPPPTSTLDSNTRPTTSFKPGSIKIPNTLVSMTESTAAMSKNNAAETTTSMFVKTSTKNNTSRVISTRSTTTSNKSFEKSSTTEPTTFTSTLASINFTIVATKMATGSSTPKYRTLSSTPPVKSGQAISSLLIKGDVRVHLDQVKKVIARLISSSPNYKESDSLSISANSKIVLGNNGEKVTQIIYTVSYAGNNLTAEEISRMVNDPTSNIQTLSSALETIGMQQYKGEITDATTQNDKNWIEEHVGVVAGVGSAILLLLVLSVVCIVRRKRSVHKEQAPHYPVDDDVSSTSGNQELKGIKSDFNGHIATGALKSKYTTNF